VLGEGALETESGGAIASCRGRGGRSRRPTNRADWTHCPSHRRPLGRSAEMVSCNRLSKTLCINAPMLSLRESQASEKTRAQRCFPGRNRPAEWPLIARGSCVEQFGTGKHIFPVLARSLACRGPEGERIIACWAPCPDMARADAADSVHDENLQTLLRGSKVRRKRACFATG